MFIQSKDFIKITFSINRTTQGIVILIFYNPYYLHASHKWPFNTHIFLVFHVSIIFIISAKCF